MDYSKTPLWMQDDLVKDIPREKLEFLSTLFTKGHGKSQKEMMALLMPAMRKAKQEHLTFTPQEMQAAITAIKNKAMITARITVAVSASSPCRPILPKMLTNAAITADKTA